MGKRILHKGSTILIAIPHQRKDRGITDEKGRLLHKEPPKNQKRAVLGRSVLQEVWADQSRLELPSYVSRGPKELGSSEQRVTADKRRAVATIHLVVTLVRLWGDKTTGRKWDMLCNYMHLIQALLIANRRKAMDAQAVGDYVRHYKLYLEGYVELYKEAPIHPNHHLCLHIAKFLRLFGPVHSWRSWVFERFNYLLQRIDTNKQFGMKYLFYFCYCSPIDDVSYRTT